MGMMYTNPSQNYNSNNWQPAAQVSNWSGYGNSDYANQMAQGWYPSWQVVDSVHIGRHYKIHMRDMDGDYRTVMMDDNYNMMRSMPGYC